ncbi:MAG TPA: FxsA family protein [Actinomycetota bacterium]|nr:FxsA family protein [Actinomycetota bacterium]
MTGILAVLFLVVPLAEIYVLVKVGQVIGVLETIGLLVVVSIAGAWLAKREGLGVYRRFREQVGQGRVPGAEIVDGVLVIMAGAMLLTPGFLTDVAALVLLLPPVRASVRRALMRFATGRVGARLANSRRTLL